MRPTIKKIACLSAAVLLVGCGLPLDNERAKAQGKRNWVPAPSERLGESYHDANRRLQKNDQWSVRSDENAVVLTDLKSGQETRIPPINAISFLHDFSVDFDSRIVVASYGTESLYVGHYLRVIDIESGEERFFLDPEYSFKGSQIIAKNLILVRSPSEKPRPFLEMSRDQIESRFADVTNRKVIQSLGGVLTSVNLSSSKSETIESCDGEITEFLLFSSGGFAYENGIAIARGVEFIVRDRNGKAQSRMRDSLIPADFYFKLSMDNDRPCVVKFAITPDE